MTFPFPFFVPSARLPPAYINQTDASIASTTSVSFSHTTTAATSALIVLVQGYDSGAGGTPAISSVTFDGVTLTAGPAVVGGASGFDHQSSIAYIFSPGAKTANVVVTFAASVLGRVQAVNVSGVTALDTSGTDNVVTPLEVALVTSAPTIMFGVGVGNKSGAPTFTWSSGVNELQDLSPTANLSFAAGYRLGAAAESYTFQMIPNATLNSGELAVAAFR